jgi:hypothetical protein
MTFKFPEEYRLKSGPLGSSQADGNNGAGFIPTRPGQTPLKFICSDGAGWEHVSVSLPNRCPTWEEMCKVKDLFWTQDECVVQFHPPRSEYVNNHPYCLHLWRPISCQMPMPPSILVGVKGDRIYVDELENALR